MRGYNAERDGTPAEAIAKIKAQVQKEFDARLTELPTNAGEEMHKKTVKYLIKKEAEQQELDNQGGEL